MRKTHSAKSLTVLLALALTMCLVSVAQATNIYVSGFTADEIFENQSGSAITAAADGADNAWGQLGFAAGANSITAGLPDSGSFVSATGSGVTYQFGSYTDNNALRLTDGGSGTIEVAHGNFTQLHILATSGDGPGDCNIVLNFSDGSHSTYTDALIAPDWSATIYGSSVALGNLERVALVSSSLDPKSIDTRLDFNFYETALTLSAPDQAKTLVNITFDDNSGSGPVTSIYAVDGTGTLVPLPGSLLLVGSGFLGLFGYRGRRFLSRS